MLFNPLLTSLPGESGEPGRVYEPASASVNKLYFGDNLDVLREVADLLRDNLDENGGGNQSLKRRPVALA